MNNVPEYIKVCYSPVSPICDVRLKPLCLGHVELLIAYKSPFILDTGKVISIDDLSFFLGICSRTWEEGKEFVEDRTQCLEFVFKRQLYFQTTPNFNLGREIDRIQEYINNNNSHPLYSINTSNDGELPGTYWTQNQKLTLMSLGYSESRTMNMPIGQVFWDTAWKAQSNGTITIFDEETTELLRAAEKAKKQES